MNHPNPYVVVELEYFANYESNIVNVFGPFTKKQAEEFASNSSSTSANQFDVHQLQPQP